MNENIDIDALNDLASSFEDGYTSEAIESVLSQIRDLTGLRLVCMWAYNDCWGTGGDSNIHHVADDGTVYDIPPSLWALLLDGTKLAPGQLQAEVAAPTQTDPIGDTRIELDAFNWVARDWGEREAPSMTAGRWVEPQH